MIVEDEETLRTALSDKLSREGFSVYTAQDGEEGIRMVRMHSPDLILLDVVMPRLDGLSMLDKLYQEMPKAKQIPILILTNLGDQYTLSSAVVRNVRDYLVKSNWKLEDVVDRVRQRLREASGEE